MKNEKHINIKKFLQDWCKTDDMIPSSFKKVQEGWAEKTSDWIQRNYHELRNEIQKSIGSNVENQKENVVRLKVEWEKKQAYADSLQDALLKNQSSDPANLRSRYYEAREDSDFIKSLYDQSVDYLNRLQNNRANFIVASSLISLSLLIMSSVYIYRRFLSAAAKSCSSLSGIDKSICIINYQIQAAKKTIIEIQKLKSEASKLDEKNKQKVLNRIEKVTRKMNHKIEKLQNKLKDLKNKQIIQKSKG